jgi:hypothetical protein
VKRDGYGEAAEEPALHCLPSAEACAVQCSSFQSPAVSVPPYQSRTIGPAASVPREPSRRYMGNRSMGNRSMGTGEPLR